MECKAKSTFDQWMTLAKLFCEEKFAVCVVNEDERRLSDESQDYFYDADDTSTSFSTPSPGVHMDGVIPPMQKADQSRVPNGILNRFRSVFSSTTTMDASSIQIILREMNEIEISCRAVQGHVEKMNVEMLQMDENVKKMNKEMLQIRDDIQSMRLAMAKKQEEVLMPRREGLILFVGLATGFALGYAYMKARNRL